MSSHCVSSWPTNPQPSPPCHANQPGQPIASTVASITADQRFLVGHIPLSTKLHVSQEAAVMALTPAWMRFAHLGTNDGVWSIDPMAPHAILPHVAILRVLFTFLVWERSLCRF